MMTKSQEKGVPSWDTLFYTEGKRRTIMMAMKKNEEGYLLKKYKVAICDEEVDFAFSLMNYMNGEKEYPCSGVAFTNEEHLFHYIKEQKVDLILLGEQMEVELEGDTKILWLTEEALKIQTGSVYKYQSGEMLLKNILDAIEEGRERRLSVGRQKDCLIYAVYSPIGRCGKTNLARGICANYMGRSLYIGFEEYGSFEDETGISQELLYYMKNKDEGFHVRLKQFSIQEGQSYLVPSPRCYLDLRMLEREDIEWLLEQLKEEGTYERIVFDIGTGSLFDFSIFSLFDRIFIPTLEGETANRKKENFLKFIREQEEYVWEKKLYFLQVPNTNYNSLKMEEYVSELFREEKAVF